MPGIQLAHAGRKGSTRVPWPGRGYIQPGDGGWRTVGASPLGYEPWPAPHPLDAGEISSLVSAWADAARRAVAAGFDIIELHVAHGYLLHQFLSPLSNQRTDCYGGDLTGRSRLLVEVADAVRAAVPDRVALLVRLSATDWVPGGLVTDDAAMVAHTLASHGVDLIDVSSGGLSPEQKITTGPGYQVPFAATVRRGSSLPVAAVGEITEPKQAEQILVDGDADAVLLARGLLREAAWAQRAAHELGDDVYWPVQYQRARPAGS